MPEKFFGTLDSQVKEKLSSLRLEDCKQLQLWLKKRIIYLKKLPFVKRKIEELNLSPRACNALKQQQLHTVEDIFIYGIEKISLIKNIGAKTVDEIRTAIRI